MCVIIVKPAGVALPASDVLNAAAKANPHGFGFATSTRIFKSLNLNAFMRELAKVPAFEPCIMHFRYATHGSIKRANCHPFFMGDAMLGNVVFAHNGILDVEPVGDMTDSETAFRYIIYPAICDYGFGSAEADQIINEARGFSKFALMNGSDVRLYGNFEQAGDGCYYSNYNFVRYLTRQPLNIAI